MNRRWRSGLVKAWQLDRDDEERLWMKPSIVMEINILDRLQVWV